MDQNQTQTGMVFYNFNPADGTVTAGTPVHIEFGSADVARQINQQVQMQYANPSGILTGQTQQIIITQQPVFDTTENIDPILIKAPKSKMRQAGERVPCPECKKTFSCNANLRDHMRLHTGERPFQCTECGMAFAQRSNWRLHKRVHTGERPYMCGICGKTFSRSSHLPGHIRVHTGERPFQCEHCDHNFSSSQALKNHLRTHTGEKPYCCNHCSTAFTHSSSLSSHRKRCTGEKRKRGRPVGSGRRKRRSSSRPRGRPKKKTRFGRGRRAKVEGESVDEEEVEEDEEIIESEDIKEEIEHVEEEDNPVAVEMTVNVNNELEPLETSINNEANSLVELTVSNNTEPQSNFIEMAEAAQNQSIKITTNSHDPVEPIVFKKCEMPINNPSAVVLSAPNSVNHLINQPHTIIVSTSTNLKHNSFVQDSIKKETNGYQAVDDEKTITVYRHESPERDVSMSTITDSNSTLPI